ncbi:MAG: adenylate kinase [Clostridia bacterium]|nr:adenylate kinase [Clostridia bacterium]MBO7736547.1 adenylate kinase [Clostridia bacterium]MBR7099547.1 adenylate kinase [Clostridia bacterium]
MNIILLGAPGAGKGTQATKIADKYGMPHISTGDIFRANIKNQTEIGLLAKSYIDKGQLVPDAVTCKIVENRLAEDDCKQKGYLLDGFPRTIAQAEELDKFAKIDAVVNINIDFSLLMNRLCGRRVCKDCGESFHVSTLNGATTCSRCGGELYQRKDDNPETVQSRLDVYTEQTAPLIDYYTKKGIILNFVGTDDPPQVLFGEIAAELDKLVK